MNITPLEGRIFLKEVTAAPLQVQVVIPVPQVVTRVVHRFKGGPVTVCQPRHTLEGGVLSEQIIVTEFMQLDAGVLVPQVIARIIHRLERHMALVRESCHHPERGIFAVQIISAPG